MPFARRTLTQLRDGAIQDITASPIYDSDTGEVVNPLLLQFDPLTILAKVMAGLAYEEYGYLDYISLQATPFTATDETAIGWGAFKGVIRKQATAATGTATFTIIGPTPVDIPSGTQLTRTDGVSYATTDDVIIPGSGTVTVPFQAVDVGADGTIAAGAVISLASGIAGLDPNGVVAASTAPGADIETMDAFRARYLAVYAKPPNGGSLSDYEEWALAVPGVTRAWAKGLVMGPGTVGVFFMLDISEAANDGFPVGTDGISPNDNGGDPRDPARIATGDQLTVANAIIPDQPVTALVYALSPTPDPVAFAITALGAANTADNQNAIKAALTEMLQAVGTPLGGLIYPQSWYNAISAVLGSATFNVPTPSGPITTTTGQLPTLGTVTFST